ncbi:virulence factor [Bacillus sp. FJAT-42376]|uniref:conserved virulence factor C family protein n=1 Tax=Bacillus sp. FJAT-42376 TaxID=2014076 RepID=UPI000F500ADD|nr:conserved virulence factor C family protein [Bacillus sp. FJAT-42376]AZB44870.1 virulence factor [Bacillus sp. FJAT-42376]
MNIKTIEPTPSPNTMKIILTEELPKGTSNNYKKDQSEHAPQVIQDILQVEGVKGVYHVADFLAVERNAKYDWKEILSNVRECFGESPAANGISGPADDAFGEVKASVQMYNGIPMQVKLTDGMQEKRYALPQRFQDILFSVQQHASNVVLNRVWKDHGVRYGDMDEIGNDMVEELSAAYKEERLKRIAQQMINKEEGVQAISRPAYKVTEEMMEEPEWTARYAHLEQMDPKAEDLDVLRKALSDEKASIRRLAVVYLGMIEDEAVLPLLYKALEDKSVTVRRTAGDCLSDIGDPKAIPAMMASLKDKNKLVRWRAAMFLYEVGDEQALEALKAAEDDPEFEVSMQIKLAIGRIEGGEEAMGSVWKQMTESRKTSE